MTETGVKDRKKSSNGDRDNGEKTKDTAYAAQTGTTGTGKERIKEDENVGERGERRGRGKTAKKQTPPEPQMNKETRRKSATGGEKARKI